MAELNISVATLSGTLGSFSQTITGRVYVNYTVSNSDASATITAYVKVAISSSGSGVFLGSGKLSATNTGSAIHGGSWTLNGGTSTNLDLPTLSGNTSKTISSAKTATITKTHSAQSIPVYVNPYVGLISLSADKRRSATSGLTYQVDTPLPSTATTVYITVPAKTSYVVSFNANGGTGAPSNQTKWHGETLTLSSVTPVKDGYTFKGWATSVANASVGTVDYASGGSYTGNAAITLYAVWELVYQKPIIQNISVERCLQNGTLDDEGNYALVSFNWSVFNAAEARYYGGDTYPYANNSVDSCTVTVGTQSIAPTLTGASGTEALVVGIGTYDVDTAYDATIVISDTQIIVSDNETTGYGALPMAFFPLDYNADATALGIFMPAPDLGDGAYFGKTIHIAVDTSASIGTTDYEIVDALDDLGWNDLLE